MDSSLKISRAVTRLAYTLPFYGSCLMQSPIKELNEVGTIATDGRSVFYKDEFIQGLTEPETAGCLIHESLHIIFRHCGVLKNHDPKLANVAMDWVINHIIDQIRDNLVALPDGILRDPTGETHGWAWEEVYKFIENVKQNEEDPWKGTPNEGQSNKPLTPQQVETIKKQVENAEDHVTPSTLSPAEEKENEERVNDMVVKASQVDEASGKGSMPGEIGRVIDEIRTPKINWREELMTLVKAPYPEDYTFQRPNRKQIGNDLYLPTLNGEKAGEIVIALDTSGSVLDTEIQAFVGEVNTIINDIKPEKVWLMSADYAVAKVEEYDSNQWFSYEDFKAFGGGGTSFKPVFEHVVNENLNPDQLIYFSDMAVYSSDFPKDTPDYPVIFVSTRKNASAPFGQIVYIDLD